MSAFNKETSAEAFAKQKAKYSDISAEMRRRAKLKKHHRGGWFQIVKEQDPDRFKQIVEEREKRRAEAKESKTKR